MQTLYDKIWNQHLVCELEAGASLIYIDRHLIHEVTSPQAFEGLRNSNRKVRAPHRTLAVADHNVPTRNINKKIADPESALQIQTLVDNCKEFGIECYSLGDKRQGIVHVVGPEQGFTLPGTTIVCGDSHTSTHGAFGALAHGIGTSEVEHVLATQTLIQKKSKNMRINIKGKKAAFITAKDIILSVIGKIGTAGATGYVIEYAGEVVEKLSMAERMTICNMSIEAGARAGLIQPDQTTFEFLKDKPKTPKNQLWDKAVEKWKTLYSDQNAVFDKEITIDIENLSPLVTWGTSPQQVVDIDGVVPHIEDVEDQGQKTYLKRALDYMGLEQGVPIKELKVDRVFIGSCTNSRIEDLRKVAQVVKGYKVHPNVKAMIVPGSKIVKQQAEQEQLDKIFIEGKFEWREPGCSMCLAMNADKLEPGQRCASTSNRNFEGRQGRGGRTHLVSPQMAAAAAIKGRFYDVRKWQFR